MRVQLRDNQVFIYRVAGIAYDKERILLHKSENSSFWALPGGACEFGELGKEALEREMKEEIKADVKIENL
jgi:ADP-ribose pyrophosphatase YjhB (NUDIX family)